MNAESSPLAGSERASDPQSGSDQAGGVPVGSALVEDDDFGDVELGERQVEACSMEEGCTVCQ